MVKFKDNPPPIDISLPAPKKPGSYFVYNKITGENMGRFLKLSALRAQFIKENVSPADVVVFRVFGGEKDESRKLLFLHEYAFKSLTTEKVGSMLVEHEIWDWKPSKKNGINFQIDENNNIVYEMNQKSLGFRLKYTFSSVVFFIKNLINLV